MTILDFDALRAAPLRSDPYDHLVVPAFVHDQALQAANEDFPDIASAGSHPATGLAYGPGFGALLQAFEEGEFGRIVGEKFDLDLSTAPMTCTVRGHCQKKDGRIHTDSVTKIITVLVYLNPADKPTGGRLRFLRGADDLDDYVDEVEPVGGNLVIFRRSDHSFHGHLPFEGERRSLQLNWVTTQGVANFQHARHRVSSWIKRLSASR